MSVLAGAARADVDVPPGTAMSGFAARGGPSEGVHDPLTVRALVIDDVALVTVDVCALHERTVETLAEQIRGEARTSVIAATHTHSGPCVSHERLGSHAEQVHAAIVAAVGDAVSRASAQQRPCEVRYGETTGLGIARNRRHVRSADPPAQFLQFISGEDTVAWLVTYPCHPVVLDATNRLISGDYPSFLRERLESAAPGALCVFATGAAGDMNNGHRVEDSYEADTTGRRSFAEAERIGTALADAVLAAGSRGMPTARAEAVVEALDLTLERVGQEQAQTELDLWRSELAAGVSPARAALLRAWIAWAMELLAGAYDSVPDQWRASVTAVRLGDVTIVALPGEPFLSTAATIAAAGRPGQPVLVLGYANGCPGYLPPIEEYSHGGYEVLDAHRYYAMPGPFAPGSAERLEAAAIAAMEALHS